MALPALAALTLAATSVVSDGALTLTGVAASTWDVGGLLSLQTATNGAITTGTGLLTTGGALTVTSTTTSATYATASVGSSSSSPAALSSASAGHIVIAAGQTTVNASTTAVTANSSIFVTVEQVTPIAGTTCYTTFIPTSTPVVSGLTVSGANSGFQVKVANAPTGTPLCLAFRILN